MNKIPMTKGMKFLMAATALKFAVAATVFAVMAPHAARAEDKDDGSTAVSLSAEARKMVAQDRALTTLNYEVTGKTAQEVQALVNAKMQDAKKLYDTVKDVKVTTGQYNVYKDYQNVPEPKKGAAPIDREKYSFWRGSQEVRLDGVKSDALLKLISDLQKAGFAATGLNFYMSRDAEDAVKDGLIVEALGNIQARAKNIQQALGMKTIRYAKIDLSGTGSQPMPMMARGAMMKSMDAAEAAPMPEPVAEAGETEVVVNVTAEVRLK
jgi:predicted secreted protein